MNCTCNKGRKLPLVLLVVVLFFGVCLSFSSSSSADGAVTDSILRIFGGTFGGRSDESGAGAEPCGPELSIETPACTVVEKRDGYELRLYPKRQIWVQTLVENSSYDLATTVGFYRCFFFISGQNEKKEEIEMTGPVLIKPVQEASGYRISFFTPSRFSSKSDVPKPTNPLVEIVETTETLHAVVGPFGGFPGESGYNKKWKHLKELLDKDSEDYDVDTVTFAGYSSPFEIFNRKQEVHVTLK